MHNYNKPIWIPSLVCPLIPISNLGLVIPPCLIIGPIFAGPKSNEAMEMLSQGRSWNEPHISDFFPHNPPPPVMPMQHSNYYYLLRAPAGAPTDHNRQVSAMPDPEAASSAAAENQETINPPPFFDFLGVGAT
ncbi:hypothetical protein HS088_TW07G01040 [Tripterygium wilfordii]|uniref:Uncharacterized protein n=1 Tax=Tripterygium wilfordii TaxID=458696 RepID=A0A7J7DHC0_TRIWF|nr:hypothetical protein HS088_TW07G01040 [Tripterygium wilfordii]